MSPRALLAAVLAAAAGCGRPPAVAEIEGVVTQNGRPLPRVAVLFLADPSAPARGADAKAVTGEDGRYKLRTALADGAGAGGAVFRVCLRDVSGPAPAPGSGPPRPSTRLPTAVTSVTATPFKPVEVRPGAQTYDIRVPASRVAAPRKPVPARASQARPTAKS